MMIKKFYSLDGINQTEFEFQKVDLINSADIVALLKEFTDGQVLVAKRDKSVYVLKAEEGKEVDNRQRYDIGGRSYVLKKDLKTIDKRDVELNSMLALYTNGFTKVIKGEKFQDVYELTDELWGMYTPIDDDKKYLKITKNVYFYTLWGEIIYAPRGSYLCIENINMREFFIVSNSYFEIAYTIKERLGKLENLL